RHLRAIEGSVVLQQCAEYLYGDVAWQEIRQDFLFARLVLVESSRTVCSLCRFELGRDDLASSCYLRDHRLEPREEQGRHVELAGVEELQHLVRNLVRLDETKLLHFAKRYVVDDVVLE